MMVVRIWSTVLLCSFLLVGHAAAEPMVVNGDFEGENNFNVWPGYIGTDNPANIPGWTAVEGGQGLNPIAAAHDTPAPFRDNGDNASTVAFLQGTASMSQAISGFTVGADYLLSFDFNSRNCCGDVPTATVSFDGNVIASSSDLFEGGGIASVGDANPWYHADVPFTATAETMTLAFATAPLAGGDSTLIVDNIAIVPEPSSCALLLMGLAGLAGSLRRRK
ncbi:MAG: PEP-CTERM sorting domain-containing protein [Pirellulaceae bacterium]